jgi:hypothetical protein
MKALNLICTSIDDLKSQFNDLAKDFNPNLAIAFVSSHFDIAKLPAFFRERQIELAGCTSLSETYNKTIHKKQASIMLIEMDESAFESYTAEHDGFDGYAQGKELADQALSFFKNPAILLLVSGVNFDGSSIVNGINKVTNGKIPIYGALASDDFQFVATYTLGSKGNFENGIQAIIFDTDKVNVKGASYSGWKEIGAPHTITKATKNIVYEINGKPALDEFQKYFNMRTNGALESEKITDLLAQFPLKITREDGRILVRSIMHSNEEDKSLILAGAVKEGDVFKFCSAPDLEVMDNTINSFKELQQEIPDVACSFMISCGARLAVFGPLLEREINGIYNLWEKPVIGFFSSGEIGPVRNSRNLFEFQNVTCTVLTLAPISQ